jgi:hypothetical protein
MLEVAIVSENQGSENKQPESPETPAAPGSEAAKAAETPSAPPPKSESEPTSSPPAVGFPPVSEAEVPTTPPAAAVPPTPDLASAPPPAADAPALPPPAPAPGQGYAAAAPAPAYPTFANGKPAVDEMGEPISPKSRLAAALLAWFLGFLGVHRFYVGKVGTGVLMILTLGGLGIWVLVDIIMILVGSFRDKEGLKLYNW